MTTNNEQVAKDNNVPSKTITVEREVYKAILRNSVRVIDLEAENQQLKELLKECRDGLEKIKHIGETKKLGAVYQVAERTLAKIDEVLKWKYL